MVSFPNGLIGNLLFYVLVVIHHTNSKERRSPIEAFGDVYVKECQEKNSIPVTIVNTPF